MRASDGRREAPRRRHRRCPSCCSPARRRMRSKEAQVRKLAAEPPRARRLDPPGADDRVELGGVEDDAHRGRAALPPADGARAARPLQRRGRRRAGRPAGGRAHAAADGGRAQPGPGPGGDHAAGAAGARGGRRAGSRGRRRARASGRSTPSPRRPRRPASGSSGSQVRRIFLAERVRWRRTRTWTTSPDPEFAPKGRGSSPSTPARPAGATVLDADELGPVIPRTFPPAPGWSPDGHRIKAPPGVRPGPREGVGLRRPARAGRPGPHLHRPVPQHRRLPAAAPGARPGQPRAAPST